MPNKEIITTAEMEQLKELLHKYNAFWKASRRTDIGVIKSVASFVDGDIRKRRAVVCD